MMESFKICHVIRQGTEYTLRSVDSIPGDSVCTLYVSGNGLVDEEHTKNTGKIVDKEILRYVADIPNYVIMYDSLMVADNRDERLVEMNKNGGDVLPRIGISATIYLTPKNVRDVYRRQILPIFINEGPKGFERISFVVDGDEDDVMSYIIDHVQHTMRFLHFPENIVVGTQNMILIHTYSYSDYMLPYVNEMFARVILPRISDENGQRLDLNTALRRVRKLNLLAQCHGAHVVRMMEKIMVDSMQKMGYSRDEINQIQSQVLVTAYAPSCALGDSNFQFISFMSAYDYIVDVPHNWGYKFISANRQAEVARYLEQDPDWKWFLPPMFLRGKNGNMFVVKHRFNFDRKQWLDMVKRNDYDIHKKEHNDQHFLPLNATNDGKLFGMLARNVVINGIKNSMAQDTKFTPLPPIEELVLDEPENYNLRNVFNDLALNGDVFMYYVREFVREHSDEVHAQNDITHYIHATGKKR